MLSKRSRICSSFTFTQPFLPSCSNYFHQFSLFLCPLFSDYPHLLLWFYSHCSVRNLHSTTNEQPRRSGKNLRAKISKRYPDQIPSLLFPFFCLCSSCFFQVCSSSSCMKSKLPRATNNSNSSQAIEEFSKPKTDHNTPLHPDIILVPFFFSLTPLTIFPFCSIFAACIHLLINTCTPSTFLPSLTITNYFLHQILQKTSCCI